MQKSRQIAYDDRPRVRCSIAEREGSEEEKKIKIYTFARVHTSAGYIFPGKEVTASAERTMERCRYIRFEYTQRITIGSLYGSLSLSLLGPPLGRSLFFRLKTSRKIAGTEGCGEKRDAAGHSPLRFYVCV